MSKALTFRVISLGTKHLENHVTTKYPVDVLAVGRIVRSYDETGFVSQEQ